MYFELYSWPDAKAGVWDFSVFYNTNRQKSVREVFAKESVLKGVDSLKSKIATMPKRAHVVWFSELTLSGVNVRGSEKLQRPPDEIVRQITEYAQEHSVTVVGPPNR